ncbi:MAG: protein translocase SEC61 complex subunit gamma [Candidatus Woesearchaeota archaeon]
MGLKSFTKQAIRVLKVVKKPTKEEVKTISKVTALGMLIIGLLGFLIQILVSSIMSMF